MEEGKQQPKEISPGIWLHKEHEEYIKDPSAIELSVWKVEITTMSIVEFETNFEDSENIKLEGSNGELKTSVEIGPFETKEIARIVLYPNPKIKSKFKLTLKVPSQSLQERFIQDDVKLNNELEKKCVANFFDNNFEFLSQEEIEKALSSKGITKFVDFDFPPCDSSFISEHYGQNIRETFDYCLQWRRPEDFVLLSNEINSKTPINIFNNNDPEPNDVHQENLKDNFLLSALSGIAEKYNLVSRLFKSKTTSPHGIYQISLWLNGQPKTIIVDDLFPCIPKGNPIVSRSPSNEIWVLLLEKAIAKIVGSYFTLQQLSIEDSLLMLTGCPTFCYPIASLVRDDDKSELLIKLKDYVIDKKYLAIAMARKSEENEEENEETTALTLPNLGYTVLNLIQKGKETFLTLRKVWFDKAVEDNVLEYHKKYCDLLPGLESELEDGKMMITVDDFIKEFNVLTVCYTKPWQEIRLRGKFIFGKESSTSKNELCLSKWYYCFTIDTPTNLIVSLFQEEDKIKETDSRKQVMDISLSILIYDSINAELYHKQTIDFAHTSSIQQELELPKGTYIILPRTSGCFMGRPFDIKDVKKTPLYDYENKRLTSVFMEVINDIFKKFDLQGFGTLSYNEFKGFYECVTKTTIDKDTFNNKILEIFSHYKDGLTERGFMQFFENSYLSSGESTIREWLTNLGYTEDLYCNKSRCFTLAVHSNKNINLSARDTFNSELNSKLNKILLKNFGESKEKKKKGSIVPIIIQSKLNGVITVGCENRNNQDMIVKLSVGNSNEVLVSNKKEIERVVKGNDCEYFFQFYSFFPDKIDDIDFIITSSQI